VAQPEAPTPAAGRRSVGPVRRSIGANGSGWVVEGPEREPRRRPSRCGAGAEGCVANPER
jgi:hypothetical protein